ncbi:TetR/AcrR family transcriptional regulator [Streptomyces sp. JW3]|uniref:TetR/AcrR family transcriptional regulator n=1 Tax=Streptomyces sp. JW3 TaxID=3456955 RepID=UPI003FA44F08
MTDPDQHSPFPDAREDDDRLLRRAAGALQQVQPRATMAQIAREMGIAPAALYRRFPTKEALLRALAASFFEGLLRRCEEARELPADRQLEHFLRTAGLHLATSRRVLPYAFGEMSLPEQRRRVYAVIAELLTTAKQAGAVHPDVALADIGAVVWGLRGVIESVDGIAPDAWERHLDVALAGLRNPRLTFSRPPMDAGQLDDVIRRRRPAE